MSSRLKRQAAVLKVLANSHPSVCKAIVRGADKDLLQCFGECAHNVLQGNVPLTPGQKANLTKYKQKLRKVANKKTSLKQKQKIVQTGGFLPALLAPIAAPLLKSVALPLAGKVAGGVIRSIFKKNTRKRHG